MTEHAPLSLEQPDLFHIPVQRWEDFVARFAKLNKKARRLGCPACTFEVVGEQTETRSLTFKTEDGEHTKEYEVLCRLVRVSGQAPRLADWRLVARVEALRDDKTGEVISLIHPVPGVETRVHERFRSLGPGVCEHCKALRQRRDVFVVRHDDGREVQVGRQCLADFTGGNSPEKAAAQASWLCSFRDLRDMEGGWSDSSENTLDTLEVLALTSAHIRASGWTPRSAGHGTADEVADHFSWSSQARARANADLKKLAGGVTDEDRARAAQTVEWVKTELARKEGRSDYEENLVQLVLHSIMKRAHLGIVCSAVATCLKVKSNQELRRLQQDELKKSQHIGQIGERLRSLPAKVLAVRPMSGSYGPTTLIKFLVNGRDVATWFASGDWDVQPGTECKITGTVKRHTVYQEIAETALSRVTGL